MAALLSGAGVTLKGERIFDIEDTGGRVELIVSEARPQGSDERLVYHPQRYAIGVGCARNADPEEMWDHVSKTLEAADIAPGAIACVATIDLKADESAMNTLAARLGVPLRLFTAAELEAQTPKLANPSEVVFAEVGCHGVAEGAALAIGGALNVEKSKTANTTCALTRSEQPITDFP
ncbi:MAG: cobalamin biosynthesis protein, partial [Myxococcota bacterium]